jgi:hypothetical protein
MPSQVQSIIFNKNFYSTNQAKAWLKKHKFIADFKEPHKTANFIRFRQFNPSVGLRYITKKASPGIEFIIAYK